MCLSQLEKDIHLVEFTPSCTLLIFISGKYLPGKKKVKSFSKITPSIESCHKHFIKLALIGI